MQKIILLLFLSIIYYNGYSQFRGEQDSLSIIPQPVSVSIQKGYFLLKPETAGISADAASKGVAAFLSNLLLQYYKPNVKFNARKTLSFSISTKEKIELRINKKPDVSIGDEGYVLKVTTKKIMLSANKPQGLFYGVQTLMQLIPPKDYGHEQTKNIQFKIPCVDITDYPRFGYRGMMLDMSRHFFTKEFIEKYIDEMAKYKFNVFHWHLTDDQGWRIEIKGLPKLTEVGAWRVPRTGDGTFQQPQPGEKATDGGFYTQEDIREIVQYAKQRFVNILPEIDVPAHSLALIVSYPNLSCTQKQYQVWPQYAPDSLDDVLCVANDSTWLILDKIFTQVAKLFPYKYIHVGGDEANRKFWMKDPKDIALMQKEGITTPAGLQSYFEKKLEKLIVSKGKKMIGWDEILEGGLAPEATVMSWRGEQGGIKAASMGHQVIMAPDNYTYLNRGQGDPLIEPPAPGMIWLKKCYDYDPVPQGVDPKFVMGGEACLWTEYIPNYRHLEYMTYPRAIALAEVFWSPKIKGTWNNFINRVQWQFKYLQAAQIKYATCIYDPMISAAKGPDDSMQVVLTTQIPGLDIYYTFDGTNPDNFYPEYKGEPLSIPIGASEIRVITYLDGKPIGHQVNCPFSVLEKRMKKS